MVTGEDSGGERSKHRWRETEEAVTKFFLDLLANLWFSPAIFPSASLYCPTFFFNLPFTFLPLPLWFQMVSLLIPLILLHTSTSVQDLCILLTLWLFPQCSTSYFPLFSSPFPVFHFSHQSSVCSTTNLHLIKSFTMLCFSTFSRHACYCFGLVGGAWVDTLCEMPMCLALGWCSAFLLWGHNVVRD